MAFIVVQNAYNLEKPSVLEEAMYLCTHTKLPIQMALYIRTLQTIKKHAFEATQDNTIVMGIRPPGSCLMFLPNHDICRGTAIDYMHCICLNVVRQLASLWFDAAHSSEIWSCCASLSKVDSRMESIQPRPPSTITRVTRSVSKKKFWKASEYRAWLFFYSIPVLYNILPDAYYQHYILLCEAKIYILCSSSISPEALNKSTKLLQHFYFKFSTLYSKRYLSCNMHQLLHLVDSVNELGPLFTTSCFDHEDTNGVLAKMIHSHARTDTQIVSSFSILHQMWQLSRAEAISDLVIGHKALRSIGKHSRVMSTDCALVGASTDVSGDKTVIQLLEKYEILARYQSIADFTYEVKCSIQNFTKEQLSALTME